MKIKTFKLLEIIKLDSTGYVVAVKGQLTARARVAREEQNVILYLDYRVVWRKFLTCVNIRKLDDVLGIFGFKTNKGVTV